MQTALLDRPIEVHYSIRGSGCGVTSIVVNGEAMPHITRANPYRRGATLSALMRRLSAKGNLLAIEVG